MKLKTGNYYIYHSQHQAPDHGTLRNDDGVILLGKGWFWGHAYQVQLVYRQGKRIENGPICYVRFGYLHGVAWGA